MAKCSQKISQCTSHTPAVMFLMRSHFVLSHAVRAMVMLYIHTKPLCLLWLIWQWSAHLYSNTVVVHTCMSRFWACVEMQIANHSACLDITIFTSVTSYDTHDTMCEHLLAISWWEVGHHALLLCLAQEPAVHLYLTSCVLEQLCT